MHSIFDEVLDRRHTSSYKWDQSQKLFGDADILPMWVADMDFRAPEEVVKALVERTAHGVFGYTIRTDSYYDAVINWQKRRHGWEIKREWITTSPGVVSALSILVETLTEPGDKVVLQAPVYYPFYDVIAMNGREVVNNPLRLENGQYRMDFDHLKSVLATGVKALLLCNPHNPGGRVWTMEELKTLGELCLAHGVTVVSDEIHGDLVFSGHKHIPFASISADFAEHSVVCTAPSKTFNIPGIPTSIVITQNAKIRNAYNRRLKALSIHMENALGAVAVETCYNKGERWLDELLVYLRDNLAVMSAHMAEHAPEVKVMVPEGTYLVWLDCREISDDPAVLKDLMYKSAKVAFNEGSIFGKEGRGFLRANIACPRSVMQEGIRRFAAAVRKFKG
ncbi:MAG TPA: MalY/PatB family protein [Bacilli bacterium]